MQHKHRDQTSSIFGFNAHKHVLLASALFILVLLAPLIATAHVAFADTDADFLLSPVSGTYSLGSSITITLSESSGGSDNANSVDANVIYSSNLQYVSSSQTVFGNCDFQPPDDLEIDISCTSINAPSAGTQSVATITFTVISSGATSISIDPSSEIYDIDGNPIWDGNVPVASYTATAPGSSGDGSDSSSGSSTSEAPTTPNSGGAAAGGSSVQPSSKTSSSKASGATSTNVVTTVSLVVTDDNGKPIKGAKISVDDHRTAYTNAQGKTEISGLTPGTHTVTVTASGKLASSTTFNVSANEIKNVSVRLTSQNDSTSIVACVAVGLTILGIVGFNYRRKGGFSAQSKPSAQTTPGIVVGTDTLTAAQTSDLSTEKTSSPTYIPQIVTPNNPESDTNASDEQSDDAAHPSP